MTTDADRPAPAQTVGPFFGFALPVPGGGEVAPLAHPDVIVLHGVVYDGAGEPVPDALLEFWQAGPDGSLTPRPGSLSRDGVGFTGFGRVPVDAAGHFVLRTLRPAAPPDRPDAAPYLAVVIFARGLMQHLFTRVYLPDLAERNAADPLLAGLDEARRSTLVAIREDERTYRFDIRLQGEGETVFLAYS